jgi:hypothetical protein
MANKPKSRPYLRPDSRGNGRMVETGKHHCRTPRCHGVVNMKKEHSPFCTRCRWKTWKAKNPIRYSFGNLKRRAKQRGKVFLLTFEEYRAFAIKTDYARLKGKTSLSLSIDRIDNDGPYCASNIQAISLSSNVRKQYVKFFARQMENQNYQPDAGELAAVQNQL